MRKIVLVLYNIRSIYNVGAILRTAEGLGVSEVVSAGYTPRYNDARQLPHLREKLDRAIAKAALGAEKLVPQSATDDLSAYLAAQRTAGWQIVGLENNLDAAEQKRMIRLGDTPALPLGERVVLVLGEEVHGIPPELRTQMEAFLEIPMRGQKESFNVSVATAIAVWELTKEPCKKG